MTNIDIKTIINLAEQGDESTIEEYLTGQFELVNKEPFKLAASATAQAVSFGAITNAKLVIILPEDTITVVVNGADTALPCTGIMLLNTDNNNSAGYITSLSLNNPDTANEIKGKVIIAG